MASYRVTRKSGSKLVLQIKNGNAVSDSPPGNTSAVGGQSDDMMDLAFIKLEECANEQDYDDQRFSVERWNSSDNLDNFSVNQSSDSERALEMGVSGRGRGKRGRPPGTKVTKRNIDAPVSSAHAAKFMNLEQIWALNDRQLVNYFSEPSANELTRNFAYTCALMPETCAMSFTSFGSELKARTLMKEHLLDHLRKLVSRSRVETGFEFYAQKFQATSKQASGSRGARVANKRKSNQSPARYASSSREKCQESSTLLRRQSDINSDATVQTLIKSEPPDDDVAVSIDNDLRIKKEIMLHDEDFTDPFAGSVEFPRIDHCYAIENLRKARPTIIGTGMCDSDFSPDMRTEGRRYACGDTEYDSCPSVDDERLLSVVVRIRSPLTAVASRLVIPMIRVPRAKMMMEKAIEMDAVDASHQDKEAACPEPFDKPPSHKVLQLKRRSSRPIFRHTSDYERRMAVMYMRELRLKPRDHRDTGIYICKICKAKTFTAVATLMYHYRSHAGIKPFVCTICNTTFTRQHSLNYHMLIHNNQNRFTCKECGRRFRHPSHFKEHLRRHTGETPFSCGDCPLRFKTRNTYKRHLRTRHNKLLTASGISYKLPPQGLVLDASDEPYVNVGDDDDGIVNVTDLAGLDSLNEDLQYLEGNHNSLTVIDFPPALADHFP